MTIAEKQVLISTHHIFITFLWQCDQQYYEELQPHKRQLLNWVIVTFSWKCDENVFHFFSSRHIFMTFVLQFHKNVIRQNFWWKHKILQKSIQAQIYAIVIKMWWKRDVRKKESEDVEFPFLYIFSTQFHKRNQVYYFGTIFMLFSNDTEPAFWFEYLSAKVLYRI